MSFWLISGILLAVLIFLLTNLLRPQCLWHKKFYATPKIQIHQDEASEEEAPTKSLLKTAPMISMSPMEVIKTAEKVWCFVDTRRAEVDVRSSYGSFSPTHIQDPYIFQNWSSPADSHSFVVIVSNRLGLRIAQFEYALQFVHSGSIDKKELYLENVTIIPTRVSISWGFKFNADVQMSSVRNVGTSDRPIAAVTIDQHYRLIGLNTVQRTDSFEVRDDGQYKYLNQSSYPFP